MIYTNEVIKKKKARKILLKKIFKYIYISIFVVIIMLAIYVEFMKYVKNEENASIFGFRQYVVITGSMEPKYNVGDMIIVRKTPIEKIKIGDIINYVSENGTDTITHRVVDIVNIDGQTYYKTKGDNNSSEDSGLVNYSRVKGTLVFKISKVGMLFTTLLTETGITVIFTIIVLSYLIDKNKEEKIIARENVRKIYNVPKYGSNE